MLKRKLHVLALSETKVKGKAELIFGSVIGKVFGVVNGHARKGVALVLSKRVLEGVGEYRKVLGRLRWVEVKFGGEFRVFVSAYGPGSERSEEEREAFCSQLAGCVEEGKKSGF